MGHYHYDERTQLEGAKKRRKKPGTYGSLEFRFHRDYPIGVPGVDDLITLRVFRPVKDIRPDHRVEIVRKELRGERLVAIYRGHPDIDSAQLEFVDEQKLFDALQKAKADLEYDRHHWEMRIKERRGRRQTVSSRIDIPDKVWKSVARPQAPRPMSEPLTVGDLAEFESAVRRALARIALR